MKILLGIIWLVATVFLFGFGSRHYVCSIRGLCVDEIQSPAGERAIAQETVKSTPDQFLISGTDGSTLYVFENSARVRNGSDEIEWSSDKSAVIDTVYSHLNHQIDESLVLTGYYTESPEDSSLAYQRLSTLKDQMVEEGVNADKIVIKLISNEELYSDNQVITNSFEMGFVQITSIDYALIDEGIKHKTLYSKFGKGDFKPDRTLVTYVSDLGAYLKRNPEASVSVIGHTDDVGKSSANYSLGLKRAHNVGDYLISRGVSADRIKISSEGEDNPVDSAQTEAARVKNRRIEVIVK